MIRVIWVFGNSFSNSSWVTLLGEKLGYQVKNLSKDKTCNYQIFDDFCSVCDLIHSDDIVIIGWGNVSNFRTPINNEFVCYGPNDLGDEDIDSTYIENVVRDRSSEKWCEQIYYYENILDELAKSKRYNLFFWSSDEDRLIYPARPSFKAKRSYLCNESTTCLVKYFEEKGATVIDNKFDEVGNEIVADKFYNEIKTRIHSL
jgi:hypothetical protein